jgi:hypothetical protein
MGAQGHGPGTETAGAVPCPESAALISGEVTVKGLELLRVEQGATLARIRHR